eukprot:6433916-Amphidinium_carterae.1
MLSESESPNPRKPGPCTISLLGEVIGHAERSQGLPTSMHARLRAYISQMISGRFKSKKCIRRLKE